MAEKMLYNPKFPETQSFWKSLINYVLLESHLTAFLDLLHHELSKMSVLKVNIINKLYKDKFYKFTCFGSDFL